jgi:hyperosmotically inducible periplasmic protein
MKPTAVIVVPFLALLSLALLTLALLTLAPSPLSAHARLASQTVAQKTAEGADKTKDAVVKGAKITAEKTKDGLSKTGEVMTDGWITTRVHERFITDDLLKGSDISVDTDNHVVTLTGTVTGRAGRAKATTIAKRTEGVRRVVNRLTIGPKRKD